MQNKFEKDTFMLSRPQGQLIDINAKNSNKSAILIFFQPLLNLSENWSLVTCITNLGRIHEKLFMLSRPQGRIIDVKFKNRTKSAILNFFAANIELVGELLTSNMHNKFQEDT